MIRILLAASVVLTALAASPPMPPIPLKAMTIPRGASQTSVFVDLRHERRQLLDRSIDVHLDLDAIEAEHNPRAYLDVYVHAGKPLGKSAGHVSLYGAGIRDEVRGEFRPAHVRLRITDQLRDALKNGYRVTITFVARGAVIEGVTPRTDATIVIAKPSLVILK